MVDSFFNKLLCYCILFYLSNRLGRRRGDRSRRTCRKES